MEDLAELGASAAKLADWDLKMSSVVDKLLSAGLSYNSEAELKRLKTVLPRITTVMGVADGLKVKFPETSERIEQIRQAVEASQKVLNELEDENQNEAGESGSSSKKRKQCTISDGTLKRLKVKSPETSERIEQIRQDVEASQKVLNELEDENQNEAGESGSSSKKRKQCTISDGTLKRLKVKSPETSERIEQIRQAVEESQKVLNELEDENQNEAGESGSSSKKRKQCTISDGTLKRLKVKSPETSERIEQIRQDVEASQKVLNELEDENQNEAGESGSSSKKRKQCTISDGTLKRLKVKSPETSERIEQIRQAVEESQKVLNELEDENQNEAGESGSSSKERKRCTISDGTLKRLKDAVTLLDQATTDIDRLLRLVTALVVQGVSESRQYTNTILYTNKILRQEIKICVAEIRMSGSTHLLVNLPHLKLSYLEANEFLPPTSLTRESFPCLKSCHHLNLEVGGYSLSTISLLEIESRKWLNPLSEIENLKAIRLMQNNFTLKMADSRLVSLTKRCNISISIPDLWKVFLELRTSLEEKDIKVEQSKWRNKDKVLVIQNRPSQISVEPALDWSGLEALHATQEAFSTRLRRYQKVTSSDVENLENRERHDVGESSHSNEFITTDGD